ncbi:hypothetical protein HN51_070030, partial [Arachis hypogaea]
KRLENGSKPILHLLQEDEESSSKEESNEEGKDSQVEEDCFKVETQGYSKINHELE